MELNQENLNYLINLVESTEKKDWSKAVKDLGINLHPDSLRKSFNVGDFSGYSVYKYMQEKLENECFSNEETKRLEALRDKEYKERIKLQDANREKRKYLRDFSRLETMMEYIDKKMDEKPPIVISRSPYKISENNEASLLVSDIHAGATVDNVFNSYDMNIMRKRLSQLADKTIAYCQRDGVDLLHIELLGDAITGLIHGSTIAESQDDVIDQIFAVCDALEEMILKIYESIPNVDVWIVYGNHGRVHPKKDAGSNKTNFERLIAPYLRKDLRMLNIKINDSGWDDFISYDLRDGKSIVVTHGTNDKVSSANKEFSKLLGRDIFEVHMGHFHNCIEQNGVVVNGSVMGSDDYAMSIRKHSLPQQILKTYSGNDITTHKLTLD